MRALLILSISLLAFSASANAAVCPAGTALVKSCRSTPEAGEETIASEMLDSVAICSLGDSLLFIGEKNGVSEVSVAEREMRMGGTSYSTFVDGDLTMGLSVVTGTARPVKTARFSVTFKASDISASSTYTCK